MSALVFLIPVALGLGLLGLAAFLWSLRSGQFDDLDGAAYRAVFDDDIVPPTEEQNSEVSKAPGKKL
ncbi:cbb3-type cytochrome oxidase assembly protein CcoS [Kiloniella laminariae]|uniref:cbb3-type cytochrome oxidase assembly protein CcoS n=1 Tax=Kiloniella laminariae TaxID=454162 RepID=UPI00035F672B|nr:cbb3-type cytochrome oxidase assembly protein CcoS [Kiloniella laminariae]